LAERPLTHVVACGLRASWPVFNSSDAHTQQTAYTSLTRAKAVCYELRVEMDNSARAAAAPSGKYGALQPKLPVRLLSQVRHCRAVPLPNITNCWQAIFQLPGLNNCGLAAAELWHKAVLRLGRVCAAAAGAAAGRRRAHTAACGDAASEARRPRLQGAWRLTAGAEQLGQGCVAETMKCPRLACMHRSIGVLLKSGPGFWAPGMLPFHGLRVCSLPQLCKLLCL